MAKKKDTKSTWSLLQSKILGLICALAFLYVMLSIQGAIFNSGKSGKIHSRITPQKPESVISFRDGDIIFQEKIGKTGEFISGETGSVLNNCGLIMIKDKKVFVLDSENKTGEISLEDWIKKGNDKKFALMRYPYLEDSDESKILKECQKAAEDQFEWADQKLEPSELVFKTYREAVGVELGRPVVIGKPKKTGADRANRLSAGEKLPLSRRVVTPAGIYGDYKLNKIYDDFNIRRSVTEARGERVERIEKSKRSERKDIGGRGASGRR